VTSLSNELGRLVTVEEVTPLVEAALTSAFRGVTRAAQPA
jgi:hypothetical protein